MTNPLQAVNADFNYNTALARALLQFYPPAERRLGRDWLRYLTFIPNSSMDELTKRNNYAWFLLLVLQRGGNELTPPFCDPPPVGQDLLPLKDILAPEVYEEVLTASSKDTILTRPIMPQLWHRWERPKNPFPEEFIKSQPVPPDGVLCYMAAFCDPDFCE
ncbi:hypothetical protein J437_LFUL014311 [Ladona fulva]|uniref:DUF4485 domain-containing protein n=1 Tax=Ladona fulva TaxID=123851 RepID=A0A8K0P5D4_LADFU|nr:hypothetical protein J437_LFUL014311 [Ladona fulva]